MFRIVSTVLVSFLILSCGTFFFFRKNGKKAAKHKFIPSFYSRMHLVPIDILHSRVTAALSHITRYIVSHIKR